MLTIHNTSKVYQKIKGKTDALKALFLPVKSIQFIDVITHLGVIITLLNIAAMIEPFTSSQYLADDIDLGQLDDDYRDDFRNQNISYIFHGFNLLADLIDIIALFN